tara:strand:- start:96 stop:968 length:873 start_codon:yes stop_codon:yes gene_type:complete
MTLKEIKIDLKKNLINNLKSHNISPNDHLYLGVNVGMIFYRYIKNPKIIDLINKNKLELTKFILKILKDYISKNGSLICPTFSYSTTNTGFFDIKKTKTNLGIFSQVFLEDKSSLRSDHSIHSISAIGKFKEIIKKGHGDFSFGINSPFEDFLKFKVKFINIGVNFWKTCTYVNHVLHLNGCNYRFYKSFKVKKKIGNVTKYSYDFDLLRYKNISDTLKNEIIIEKILNKKKLINYSKKPIFFSVTDAKSVYNETKIILKKDSGIFLKGSKKVIFNDNLKNKNFIKIKIV